MKMRLKVRFLAAKIFFPHSKKYDKKKSDFFFVAFGFGIIFRKFRSFPKNFQD